MAIINQILKKTLLCIVIGLITILNVGAVCKENTKSTLVKKQEIYVVYSTWNECIEVGNTVKAKDVLDTKELENVYLDREYEFASVARVGKTGGFLVTYKVIKDK